MRVAVRVVEHVSVKGEVVVGKAGPARVMEQPVGGRGEVEMRTELVVDEVYPDAQLRKVEVGHFVEAKVIGWSDLGGWREMPGDALQVRVPLIVVPLGAVAG